MNLVPFVNDDGTPNAAAAFVAMLIFKGMYEENASPFETYVDMTKPNTSDYLQNTDAFEADFGVIRKRNEVMVLFAGTKNWQQWASYGPGGLFAAPDPITWHTVNQAFLNILGRVEDRVMRAVGPLNNVTVRVTGHSLGGAMAIIFGTHLKRRAGRNCRIEVMTIAAPKAFYGIVFGSLPDSDQRIVIHGDPVPLIPPANAPVLTPLVNLSRVLPLPSQLRQLFGGIGIWHHVGERFFIENNQFVQYNYNPLVDNDLVEIPRNVTGDFGVHVPVTGRGAEARGYLPATFRVFQSKPEFESYRRLFGFFTFYTGIEVPVSTSPIQEGRHIMAWFTPLALQRIAELRQYFATNPPDVARGTASVENFEIRFLDLWADAAETSGNLADFNSNSMLALVRADTRDTPRGSVLRREVAGLVDILYGVARNEYGSQYAQETLENVRRASRPRLDADGFPVLPPPASDNLGTGFRQVIPVPPTSPEYEYPGAYPRLPGEPALPAPSFDPPPAPASPAVLPSGFLEAALLTTPPPQRAANVGGQPPPLPPPPAPLRTTGPLSRRTSLFGGDGTQLAGGVPDYFALYQQYVEGAINQGSEPLEYFQWLQLYWSQGGR